MHSIECAPARKNVLLADRTYLRSFGRQLYRCGTVEEFHLTSKGPKPFADATSSVMSLRQDTLWSMWITEKFHSAKQNITTGKNCGFPLQRTNVRLYYKDGREI